MKRLKRIYESVYSMENLELSEKKARRGKGTQPGVIEFDKDRQANLEAIQSMLKNKTYKISPYTTFSIFEPKERIVFRLPYMPDRIIQHAIMIPLERMFNNCFTADTYSCIKGRGIKAATFAVRKALKDIPGTKYCLKFDIKKFYLNIDHTILKRLLRKKIKDADLLWLLDEIIDSAPGLPIGNYLSQYLANFYMAYFDHWIKEVKGVKDYFRYADDVVIPSDSKEYLHQLLADIRTYLSVELKLTIKDNYQIFLVSSRGIDFVGYVKFHTHVRLRPRIKKSAARALSRSKSRQTMASYYGWMKYCNSYNLRNKLKIAA